jgi:ribokinase
MLCPEVVAVGCPSTDILLSDKGMHRAVGGAAYITALAARLAGARVGLVARVPRCLPTDVARAFGPGGLDRLGLRLAEGSLPAFQIAYDDQHNASYGEFSPGVEAQLCAADFPEAWIQGVHIVHLASIAGDVALQLQFLDELQARGYGGLVSAGTYLRMVRASPERVGELLLRSDLFFCNEREAELLFPEGPPRHWSGMLCVTCGGDGVRVWSHGTSRSYPAARGEIVDATGAGDAFCGGFLGALARGLEPVPAALAIAAEALSGQGATPLIEHIERDMTPRAEVDEDRVQIMARALRAAATTSALDFCGFPFPEADDPLALDNLAAATLHQYGFWNADLGGWQEPMYALADGRRFKGSDYIWQAFTRAAQRDASVFDPERMAGEPDLFVSMCRGDDGRCPLPDLDSHVALHRSYGAALVRDYPGGFIEVLEEVRDEARPAAALLAKLSELPGYAEDPLAKKANLLVVMLAARPEGFLELRDPESIQPIVDYHLMRGCLRTGCVRILDPDLRRRVEERTWVDGEEERAIRAAAFAAIEQLVKVSGCSVAQVDGFFFVNGRARCLEDREPQCEECPVRESCARETRLFQPIFRTTAY